MKLKEIRLKNFRCYEDLTVPLHEQLTVLVAPNGQGKTAILDAISIALWDFVKKFDLAKPSPAYNIGISKNDIRIIKDIEEIVEYRLQGGMIRQLDTEIIATDLNNFTWKRYKDSETAGSRTKEDSNARLLQKKAQKIQKNIRNSQLEVQDLPLFAYYGTGRLWHEKRLMKKQRQNKNDKKIRTFAYQNSLDPASSYKQFEDWFIQKYKELSREYAISRETKEDISEIFRKIQSEIANVSDAINIVLKIVEWRNPEYSEIFDNEIVLEHPQHGLLKLNQLSDGIQNIFGMVADIAYRCYLLNSHLNENAAKETEGIVLIDEVDMHLHPAWQQTILQDLKIAFPKLQFIVTTHSPQVLTTVRSECIRMIDGQNIYFAPAGTKGAEASRLLDRIFGVKNRPPQDENTLMLAEYRRLVYKDEWNSEKALALRKQLDVIFQNEEPELTALDLYIDNREWEMSLEENQ